MKLHCDYKFGKNNEYLQNSLSAFSTAKGNTGFRVLHQLKLQCVNIIRKTMITLGQALGLTQEFFSIVESHHKPLSFSPKLINQGIKRIEVLASETSLFGFLITSCYGFFDKSFFGFNIRLGSNQFVNGHTLYGTQDLFQAGHEAGIFDVQNNLCHNYKVRFILPAKIDRNSETARGRKIYMDKLLRSFIIVFVPIFKTYYYFRTVGHFQL